MPVPKAGVINDHNIVVRFAKDALHFFSPFCSASPEIIGVKVYHRWTDKFFDTIYGGMRVFLSAKFATSLLASLVRGQNCKV